MKKLDFLNKVYCETAMMLLRALGTASIDSVIADPKLIVYIYLKGRALQFHTNSNTTFGIPLQERLDTFLCSDLCCCWHM